MGGVYAGCERRGGAEMAGLARVLMGLELAREWERVGDFLGAFGWPLDLRRVGL